MGGDRESGRKNWCSSFFRDNQVLLLSHLTGGGGGSKSILDEGGSQNKYEREKQYCSLSTGERLTSVGYGPFCEQTAERSTKKEENI